MRAINLISSFWSSREVEQHITQTMRQKDSKWEIAPGMSPMAALRQEIVRQNTKGNYRTIPQMDQPHGYLFDQLPFARDDGSRTFLRFRYALGLAVELFSLFGQRVMESLGTDSWKLASAFFDQDAQDRTLFQILQNITSAPRPIAIDWLQSISRKGVRIPWPGGFDSFFRSSDCGFGALVDVSHKVVAQLARNKTEDSGDPGSQSPEERKRVTVDFANKTLTKLLFQGKVVELHGITRRLFMALFGEKDVVPFDIIWAKVFEEKAKVAYFADKRGGPPPRMRTQKCALNHSLVKKFGLPPGRRFWVETHKGQGYMLNRSSVIWQLAKDFEGSRSFLTREPRLLDTLPE